MKQTTSTGNVEPLTGRGGPGRGGGRRLESGAKAVSKTITIDPADVEFLKRPGIGDGELSRGIRRATQALREKEAQDQAKALRNV